MTFRLIAAIAATIIGGAALAGSMFGTIKDEKGSPVANAVIKVFGKDDLKTTTDITGKFKIESKDLLDGDKYSVNVTADGYNEVQTISVEMFDNPKDMDPIEITLTKSEPIPEPSTNRVNTPYSSYRFAYRTNMMARTGAPSPDLTETEEDDEPTTTNAVSAKVPAPATTNAPPAAAKSAK